MEKVLFGSEAALKNSRKKVSFGSEAALKICEKLLHCRGVDPIALIKRVNAM